MTNAHVTHSVNNAKALAKALVTGDSLKAKVNELIKAEHAYRKANNISTGRAQPTAKQPADVFFATLLDSIVAGRKAAKLPAWGEGTIKVFLSRVRKALIEGTDLISEQRAKKKPGARTPTKGAENPDVLNESEETSAPEIPAAAGAVKSGRGQVVTLTIPKGMSASEVAAGILNALSASSEDLATLAAFLKPQIAKFIGKAK